MIFPVEKMINSEKNRRKAIMNCKQFYKQLQGAHVISSSLYMKDETERPELAPKRTHEIKKIKSTYLKISIISNMY